MSKSVAEVPELLEQLYMIVARLERLFPERRFTLDGHLVGIGEVLEPMPTVWT